MARLPLLLSLQSLQFPTLLLIPLLPLLLDRSQLPNPLLHRRKWIIRIHACHFPFPPQRILIPPNILPRHSIRRYHIAASRRIPRLLTNRLPEPSSIGEPHRVLVFVSAFLIRCLFLRVRVLLYRLLCRFRRKEIEMPGTVQQRGITRAGGSLFLPSRKCLFCIFLRISDISVRVILASESSALPVSAGIIVAVFLVRRVRWRRRRRRRRGRWSLASKYLDPALGIDFLHATLGFLLLGFGLCLIAPDAGDVLGVVDVP